MLAKNIFTPKCLPCRLKLQNKMAWTCSTKSAGTLLHQRSIVLHFGALNILADLKAADVNQLKTLNYQFET